MKEKLDQALNHEHVNVLRRDDESGIYIINLGVLGEPITIKLTPDRDGIHTAFDLSHAIHTPVQATPYRTSRPFDDDHAYALSRAISGLTMYYDMAIEAGHQPSEEWLVPYRSS